jgi:apolipoprotein N-acyltransferase
MATSALAAPVVGELPLPVRRSKAVRRPPRRRWEGLALRLLLVFAAGGLHAAGWLFPGAWPTVWAGQAGLIALGVSTTPRRAFGYGTLVGVIGIASSFYWGIESLQQTFDATPAVAWTVFAMLVLLEAIGFGALCCVSSWAALRGIRWMWIVPCTWVAVEHWFPRVFPWRMGYSQLEMLPLVQIAELVGSTGIGFVITAAAAVPSVLHLTFRRAAKDADRRWAGGYCIAVGLLLAATLAFGGLRLSEWERWCSEQPKLKVALIQVDPSYVGAEKKLRERSEAVHDQVDLICWPESAVGTYSEKLTHFRDRRATMRMSRHSLKLLEPAKDFACHLLAGGKQFREGAQEEGPYSMTAFLISPQQDIVGRYRKRTLLPFGEYIPGQRWFPAVREWATLQQIFEAGTDSDPLGTTAGQRLGVVICYEDTLARNVNRTVAAGAEALVSLIQGGSFKNRLTLVQHQRLAILRAVENRRYFIRCASTGVTCVVSPTGRVIDQLPPQEDGTLFSDISLIRERTLYSRIGDLFPIACTLLVAVGMAFSRRLPLAIHNSWREL